MIKDYLGTGKPVVVERVPIDVPEGYELFLKSVSEIKQLNLIFMDKAGKRWYSNSPYKINSIDEYVCDACGGSGKTICREAYTCPSCKGECKIKRKVIDITVEKVGCIGCCVHKTDWASGICDITDCDDGCPLTKEEITKAPKCKDCKGKDNFQFEIRRAGI